MQHDDQSALYTKFQMPSFKTHEPQNFTSSSAVADEPAWRAAIRQTAKF